MSLQKGWTNLTPEQRTTLLIRSEGGEERESLAKLARVRYGVEIRPSTLARRLREWRVLRDGNVPPRKPQHKTSHKETDNTMTLSAVSERIRSLDDLLEEFQIDPDVWEVTNFIINSYESFRKDVEKDLTFNGPGEIHGHVEDHGGVVIVPLFQIKAWLVRREPVAVEPVLAHMHLEGLTPPISKIIQHDRLSTALLIADPQIGFTKESIHGSEMINFHDREALDVALQLAAWIQPDKLIYVGDYLDMTDWQDKFIRRPEFIQMTQPAIIEGSWWLAQFRLAVEEAHAVFLEGNHEVRAINSLIKNLPAAYGLKPVITHGGKKVEAIVLASHPALSIPMLLGLAHLGVEYVGGYPDGYYRLNNALRIEHGAVARAGLSDTAKAVIKNESESVIIGHIHRFEAVTKTLYGANGPTYATAQSIGALCKLGSGVPGAKKRAQWQQGVALVHYDPNGTAFNIQPIYINQGEALYDGQYFRARPESETVERLRKDTDWAF